MSVVVVNDKNAWPFLSEKRTHQGQFPRSGHICIFQNVAHMSTTFLSNRIHVRHVRMLGRALVTLFDEVCFGFSLSKIGCRRARAARVLCTSPGPVVYVFVVFHYL